MKSLLRLFKQNKILVTITFIVTFLSIGVQLFWTLFVGKLADKIVERHHISSIFISSMVLVLLLNASFQYINQMVSRYTSERLAHTLRMNFIDSILRPKKLPSPISSSEAISKVQNELLLASDYMSSTLFDIVGMGLSGLFSLLFLLILNPILTIIILLPMLAVVIFTQQMGKRLVPLANKGMDMKSTQNTIAHSAITNYEAIKIYDGEIFFKKNTKKVSKYGQSLKQGVTASVQL